MSVYMSVLASSHRRQVWQSRSVNWRRGVISLIFILDVMMPVAWSLTVIYWLSFTG